MSPSHKIEQRHLGSGGLRVSALGLGCMGLSGVYGPAEDEASIAVVHHALDSGINLLDSADVYGVGHNEKLLSHVLKDRRDDIVLATKFGQFRSPTGGNGINGRPEYVLEACDASLQRLGVDHIDLYYQHRVDPTVPIEDTVGAMAKLVSQGKVRYLGLSEASPETIRRAHKIHPIAAVQTEYSLLYRVEAEETLVTTRELGIGFVAYSPLGRGFLTGVVKSKTDVPGGRFDMPRYQDAYFAHNLALVEKIEKIAAEKSCTPGQLVLAWVLAQGTDIVAIPGTKRKERLDENLGALAVQLTEDDSERISAAIPPGAGAGDRYPEAAMKALQR